jgi:hypothetical protein
VVRLVQQVMRENAEAEALIDHEEQRLIRMKRGRHQGFCFRRTRSGRILPYICWKSKFAIEFKAARLTNLTSYL